VPAISTGPAGAPPASSGVAHPAGGGSLFASRRLISGASPCGVAAAASLRCACRPGDEADERPEAAVLPREEDFEDFAFDDPPLAFAVDAFAVFDPPAEDFAEVDAFARPLPPLAFALDALAAVALPDDDFALDDFALDDFAFAFVPPDDFAEVFAFPPLFALDDLARDDVPLAFARDGFARFGAAPPPLSSLPVSPERAASRALPSRLLDRRTGRERGRFEKTSLESSAIG
jgi:hypothetical protein